MIPEGHRIERHESQSLAGDVHGAFLTCIQDINARNAVIIMPTFYPQRGNLLEEAVQAGASCLIIGGREGEQEYPHVPQIGLPEMDAGAVSETFEHAIRIIRAIPPEIHDVVVFEYQSYEWFWADLIARERPDITIIGEATCYTHPVLEGKEHLTQLLMLAGLEDHIIPSVLMEQDNHDEVQLRVLYEQLKNQQNGKIVVQRCGEDHVEEGGGKTTAICVSFEGFQQEMQGTGTKKVSRYIDGHEANMSWYAGNIIPDLSGLGVLRLPLPENIDVHRPSVIPEMLRKSLHYGITQETVLVIVGRPSVKVVGDPILTAHPQNGVGNDISYQYPDHIQTQIYDIGQKLGETMALLGKVGLAGADLIIDPSGHVWVNEVNDRQQGPTARLCADARRAGIPGLDMIAWLSYYARFDDPKTVALFQKLKAQADRIGRDYMSHRHGSFYLKLNSKHDSHQGAARAVRTIEPGLFEVSRIDASRWSWTRIGETQEAPIVGVNPLRGDAFLIRLSGPVIHEGDMVPSGKQMMRIEGRMDGIGHSPIVITDQGKSSLHPVWKQAIEDLYIFIFGEGYNETNPMYRSS